MRIAVTGKQGQLAQCLLERGRSAGVEIVAVGRPDLDLMRPDSVRLALAAAKPDVIVSAAAYTAVDRAESEPKAAFAINATGAAAVAAAAAALDVPVIQLSTDYVFDGLKPTPYVETDPTGPLSVYGASKLMGEQLVAEATANHVILRTAWVYSAHGGNFLKTMLRLGAERDTVAVVADQHGCPTAADDIALAVLTVARRLTADSDSALRGIFHLTGAGEATWADFAEAIFAALAARTGRRVAVRRITTADYPTPARRPAHSLLSGARLQSAFGITLPDWRQSSAAVVARLLAGETTP